MAIIIDKLELDELTQCWAVHIDRDKPEDLSKYFINSNGYFIEGYEISFNEYLELINSVGTHIFKVRFALMKSSLSTNLLFTIVLWGEDKNGNPTTGYLKLEENDARFGGKKNTPIPDVLANERLKAWEALKDVTTPLKRIFQLDAYGGMNLRGYNYQLDDFFDILKGLENQKSEDISIHFKFCCLIYDFQKNGKTQIKEPQNGYFDLMIASSTEAYDQVLHNLFYDAGAPCPPMCGEN
ncbi:hypothetical protein [Microscilla marina]|uniref:Uncharacterized protein n=1 Tax=Microscilla marina ATCC 23134 TaxID=313606 RepID=A1ZJR7_MICM2|nr:hypothetical protein [Microscilla marina]EAY29370.1 hypothetical protein M23134_01426 [Microscilla marina ATCC 23134]